MAMSPADIEALIAELQRDPQLRDRVRSAILADDFLALPGIVRDLTEEVRLLTAEVRKLQGKLGQSGRMVIRIAVHEAVGWAHRPEVQARAANRIRRLRTPAGGV